MEPFSAALNTVASTVALANYVATRPVALDQLYLARFLPPVASTEAEIKTGSFRIVAEPAALTAVDSPYAKVGEIQSVEFTGTAFKITAETKLSEAQQDAMHARANAAILRAFQSGGTANVQAIYENFIARLNEDGIQVSLDYGEEIYRAIALAYGKIDVVDSKTGNVVQMDYGVPAEQKVTRTGNEAYDKPGSKFWDDVQAAREKLGVEPVAITDPTTWNAIMNNGANAIVSVGPPIRAAANVWVYRIAQAAATRKADGSIEYNFGQPGNDYRKNATVIVYGAKADKPGAPYFWPKGRVSFLRETARRTELIDGQVVQGNLGVTHIAPNTESGQRSVRFTKIYVPEGSEFEVIAKGSEDIAPVIEEPRNLFLAKTEVGA